ncbi:hypothetical protein EYF80_023836 [Liparis tanakae]|uniref:Uncharacterized protein n=1 Tax=Liparis tanakae TaxID=230148 RepID=A0A4Z2HLU7_9TELE|nr:hypothetical protein EYF80_023836 [Liparis tanakae]
MSSGRFAIGAEPGGAILASSLKSGREAGAKGTGAVTASREARCREGGRISWQQLARYPTPLPPRPRQNPPPLAHPGPSPTANTSPVSRVTSVSRGPVKECRPPACLPATPLQVLSAGRHPFCSHVTE